jgi:hypothetical protein
MLHLGPLRSLVLHEVKAPSAAVNMGVACGTKCNQVLLTIITGTATKLFVMNFKIRHSAAELASPAVSAQHLKSKLLIRDEV